MSCPTNSVCNKWVANQVICYKTPNSCHDSIKIKHMKITSLAELYLANSGV